MSTESHEADLLNRQITDLQNKKQAIDQKTAAKQARNQQRKQAYDRAVDEYRQRCASCGAHLKAWNRLFIALQNAIDRKEPIPNHLYRHRDIYRLQPLEEYINDVCEPGEQPPKPPQYE